MGSHRGARLDGRPRRRGRAPAVHRGDRPYRLTGEATVRDGRLQVEVVAIGYGDVGVRLPRWVRLVRHLDLPPLPKGTTLVDAHRIGDEVSFRVRLDEVRYDLDLARVRDRDQSAAQPSR